MPNETQKNLQAQVLADVATERARQEAKWGEQNHDDFIYSAILGEEVGEAAQAVLHDKFGGKSAGTLEEELIQVAAVAVAWVECIRRNRQPLTRDEQAAEAGIRG